MYSNECDLTELLPLYQISNEQKSVKKNASIHRLKKLTFHHKLNLHCKMQQLHLLMLTTMLLACHVVIKVFPLFDTFKHSCYFIYLWTEEWFSSNILKLFLRRVKAERCFWYQWTRSRSRATNVEPGAEWLLNARSAKGKLLMLHSSHILCLTPPHKCDFVNDCPPTGFSIE